MADAKYDGQAIILGPCQVCNKFKQKFYLCVKGHSTCDDCKRNKRNATPQANSPGNRSSSLSAGLHLNLNVSAMSPNQPDSSDHHPHHHPHQHPHPHPHPSTSRGANDDCDRFINNVRPDDDNDNDDDDNDNNNNNNNNRFDFASAENRSPCQARLAPNRPQSIFAFRSPIKSLVTSPVRNKSPLQAFQKASPKASIFCEHNADVTSGPIQGNVANFANDHPQQPANSVPRPTGNVSDVLSRKLSVSSQSSNDSGSASQTLRIFCSGCNTFVQAYAVNLPGAVLQGVGGRGVETTTSPAAAELQRVDSGSTPTTPTTPTKSLKPTTSVELVRDAASKDDVDFLRHGLASAFSELLITREHLNVVMNTTEKLELDVDILRGGVNFVHVHVSSVLKRKELRIEDTINGVPLEIMVRLRLIDKEPYLGFFIGLDKLKGHSLSPLKRVVTFRAHDSYGRVVEQHELKTFENGQSVDPCFDLTKRSLQGSLWGYSQFLSKQQFLQAGMLNRGILTLSLQLDPLPEE